jgi:hypothetical protein
MNAVVLKNSRYISDELNRRNIDRSAEMADSITLTVRIDISAISRPALLSSP